MGILRTLRKTGDAVARAVSVLSVAFCLMGNIGICLCDPDPDDCGRHCHDCSSEPEDECRHLTIDLDDFLVPQSDDILPQTAADAPIRDISKTSLTADADARPRPTSTAPPDSGGTYVSYSTRIHPLS